VEICHLISEVLEILYHHPAYGPNIRIGVETDESFAYVVGDEGLLKQLLLNLAVNACEAFEGREGNLTFRVVVNEVKGTVELYVQDDGPGISAANLKKIYQPFYSTKKLGTGLGLSIVHRICSALELDISIDTQLEEGTTFLIEFRTFDQGKFRQNPEPAHATA
ncbi:MAG TPA: ATP-binding protein, partial [candidate division Zixibacteria bacterium]|nr:ATP-binding protein [candidate division Zixibacteria bacterium]